MNSARPMTSIAATVAFDVCIIALVSLTRDPWLLCLASVLAIGDAVAHGTRSRGGL